MSRHRHLPRRRARVLTRAASAAALVVAGVPAGPGRAVAQLPPPPMQLRTVAGSDGEGVATALAMQVTALAYRAGVLYAASPRGGSGDEHGAVRALDLATGRQRVIAGGERPRRDGEGPAETLRLDRVDSMTVDASGRLHLSHDHPSELVRIDGGTVVIPRYFDDPHGVGGIPRRSAIVWPGVTASAADGTVYVHQKHDYEHVLALTPGERRRVVLGGGSATGCAVGPARSVRLWQLAGLAVDAAGRLLVSSDGCVRRLEPDGSLVRVAGGAAGGGSTAPDRGDGGPAVDARLDAGTIAIDGSDLYVVDYPRIRKVAANGTISTVAGNGFQRFTTDPLTAEQAGDGQPATSVPVNPGPIAAGGGVPYFYDHATSRIRAVRDGILGTVAGNGDPLLGGDGGPAVDAQVGAVSDVAALPGGGFVMATPYSARLRRVDAAGVVSTLAGTGVTGDTGDGGPATAATLNHPWHVAAGPDGSVYVTTSRTVRRIAPNGVITRFAGNGLDEPPKDGVPATQSSLAAGGLDVGADGSVYIASYSGHSIRRVRPDGVIETIAGGNGAGYSGDGGPARLAQLSGPIDVDVQPDGGYYVADRENARIRYVSPVGVVTTVAGGGDDGQGGPHDGDGDGGPATSAYLRYPDSVARGADGALYVATSRIVREVRDGVIRTAAGRYDQYPEGAGADVTAATRAPLLGNGGLAATPQGVLVAEAAAQRVRLLLPDAGPAAPSSVSATPGSRRLTVRWTPPPPYAGSPPDSYTVTAVPSGGGRTATRTVPATESQTALVDLRNGVDYAVRVHATNGAGDGAAATTTARPGADPPGEPRDVRAKAGSGDAEVSWTAPFGGGGPIAAYRVTAQPGGRTAEAAGSAPSVTVTGLTDGTTYRFTVAARNDAGWSGESPLSEPVTPRARVTATATPSTALTGTSSVRFADPVRWVDAGNVVLRDRATGRDVAVALACAGASGAEVSCDDDLLTSVTVRPRAALTSGGWYDLMVNPPGARPVEDPYAVAVAPASTGFRASTVEQENTAGGTRRWRRVSDTRAEGGQYAVERQPGATASARVSGTRVTWLTTVGPGMGRGELWVDGVRRATYDNRAAATRWRVPRTVTGLAGGVHTITVRHAGNGPVVVDSLGGTPAYEWRRVNTAAASGGAYALADLAGADTAFRFKGTTIAWYGLRGPRYGRVAVYVDGVRHADVDYYAATASFGYRRAITGLADGLHTIRLALLGTKNARSTGTAFAFDRWGVA